MISIINITTTTNKHNNKRQHKQNKNTTPTTTTNNNKKTTTIIIIIIMNEYLVALATLLPLDGTTSQTNLTHDWLQWLKVLLGLLVWTNTYSTCAAPALHWPTHWLHLEQGGSFPQWETTWTSAGLHQSTQQERQSCSQCQAQDEEEGHQWSGCLAVCPVDKPGGWRRRRKKNKKRRKIIIIIIIRWLWWWRRKSEDYFPFSIFTKMTKKTPKLIENYSNFLY